MESKAVREARARLAAVDAKIKEFDDAFAKRDSVLAAIDAKVKRAMAKYAKRPVIKAMPQNQFELRRDGIAAFHLGWSGSEALKKAKRAPALAAALLTDNEKVTFGNSGMPGTIKGQAAKTRYVSAATVKEIDRLDWLARAAEKRAMEARARWKAAKAAAYANVANPHPTPDEIALAVAEKALLNRDRNDANAFDSYKRSRLVDYDRKYAVEHLDHALSKSDAPCPCSPCASARNQAEWAAKQKARDAERAAAAKAREKAIARAAKVSFICPACSEESVSPVVDGDVECGYEDCAWSGAAIALRTKKVPRSSRVGPVITEAA